MSFQVQRPDHLPGAALDALLASGWYRMRQTMFTCRYLLGSHGLHTAIWTRLDLQDFSFRKSQRRVMRKVEAEFDVTIRPFIMTREHSALYRRYRAHVGGDRSEELEGVLYDEGDASDRFDSWEVAISEPHPTGRGRLVAFSVFDRGRSSMQSIIGVYEPHFADRSLGYATLLYEVRWGLERGLKHHYSGYIVPGVAAFDYKRRVGRLEAWDPDLAEWGPLGELDPPDLPAQRMQSRLEELDQRLHELGLVPRLACHPPYRLVQAQRLLDWSIGLPLILDCGRLAGRRQRVIATFDPVTDQFRLDACRPNRDLSDLLAGDSIPAEGPPPEWRLLVRVRQLDSAETVEQAAQAIRRWVSGRV